MPMGRGKCGPEGCQVDERAALAALDGERGLLRELASIYCEDMPSLFEGLERAVDANDCSEARRAVHSLKGLAATFYASLPVELAQR